MATASAVAGSPSTTPHVGLVAGPERIVLDPGQSQGWLSVSNVGDGAETITATPTGTDADWLSMREGSVHVAAGQTRRLWFTVEMPLTAAPGDHAITIDVTASLDAGALNSVSAEGPRVIGKASSPVTVVVRAAGTVVTSLAAELDIPSFITTTDDVVFTPTIRNDGNVIAQWQPPTESGSEVTGHVPALQLISRVDAIADSRTLINGVTDRTGRVHATATTVLPGTSARPRVVLTNAPLLGIYDYTYSVPGSAGAESGISLTGRVVVVNVRQGVRAILVMGLLILVVLLLRRRRRTAAVALLVAALALTSMAAAQTPVQADEPTTSIAAESVSNAGAPQAAPSDQPPDVMEPAPLVDPVPSAQPTPSAEASTEPSAEPTPTPQPFPSSTDTPPESPSPPASPNPSNGPSPTASLDPCLGITTSPLGAETLPSLAALSPAQTSSPTAEESAAPCASPSPTPSGPSESIIVRFRPGTTPIAQDAAVEELGGTTTDDVAALQLQVVAVPLATADESVAAYKGHPQVLSVERDQVRTADTLPSDPQYVGQWNLPQTGWDATRDTVTLAGGATIAILDTGVASSHPDVDGVLTPGWSALGTDPMDDPNGHGTAMAGIAAARTDNGTGIAGYAFRGTRIMPIQVLDGSGSGTDSDIIAGVVWAADHGADVVLMAFSNPQYSAGLQAAMDYAWMRGVVLVAATGNDASSTVTYPAGNAHVMGVAATDQQDELAASSNSGVNAFIAAPGVSIPALTTGGGTTVVSGTSAAAAQVAGAAAVLKAMDPSAPNAVIDGRLARTADQAGTRTQTGNGRINLFRAAADTSTEGVDPAGAPTGGPYVGPLLERYVAAVDSTTALTARVSGNWNAPATWANARTGSITVSNGGTSVTGVGTQFSTELRVGDTLYSYPGYTQLGVIDQISTNTSLALVAGSAAPMSNAAFGAGRAPLATDAVTIDVSGITVVIPSGYSAAAASVALGSAATANSGILSFADASSTLTVSGNVTMYQPSTTATRTIAVGAGTLTVGGSLLLGQSTMARTSSSLVDALTISTGTVNVAGSLIMNPGNYSGISALQNQIVFSGAGNLNLSGAFTVNVAGTLTPSTGKVTFNGTAAQTIPMGVSSVTYYNLTTSNTSAVGAKLSNSVSSTRVKGSIRVEAGTFDNGGFAVAGLTGMTFAVSAGATLRLGGSTTLPTTFTPSLHAASTVEYYGGTQTLSAPTGGYGNVTINSTGITSGPSSGTPIIYGTFWVRTRFSAGTRTYNFRGNFLNQGTYTTGNGTATFNGTAPQTITGATTFYNLVFNNASGFTVASNLTVNYTLTLTSGIVSTGVNTISVISTSTARVSGGSVTAFVNGILRRGIGSSTSTQTYAFPIGSGTTYARISLRVPATSVTTAGSITASTTPGNHPSIATSGLNPGQDVNRYWTMTANSPLVIGTYTPTFYWGATGDTNGTLTTSTLLVRKYTNATWSAPTTSSTYVTGPPPGETATSYSGTFGDYVVGNTGATKIAITSVNAGASPAAGTSFAVVIAAQESNGTPAGVSTDTTITLTRTAGTGTLGGTLSGIIPAGSSTVTITGVTYTKAESGVQITATPTAGMTSLTPATTTFTVVAGAVSRLQVLLPGETAVPGTGSGKTGTPTDRVAGTPFTVTVRSTDANWNLVSTTSTVAITSSDLYALLPSNAALVSGSQTFSVTFKTGNRYQSVTGTWVSGGTALTPDTSTLVTVNPGAVTKLQVLLPGESAVPGSTTGRTGSPSAQAAGTALNVTVNAVDANWNLVTSQVPDVQIGTTDAAALLPPAGGLVAGTRQFILTFTTAGVWTVSANTTGYLAPNTWASQSVTVSPGAPSRLLVLLPGQSSAPGTLSGKLGTVINATAGVPVLARVWATDGAWNPVASTAMVAITSSDANAALPTTAALIDGKGDFYVTFKTAGSSTVTATDQAASGALATGLSSTIGVLPGAAAKLQLLLAGQTPAPGTPAGHTGNPTATTAGSQVGVTINAVDAYWNVVPTSNPRVTYSSSDPNATVQAPETLVGGTMQTLVTLRTAGSRTVTASTTNFVFPNAWTSGAVTVNAGSATRLQIILPGENASPGSSTGKTGSPSERIAGSAFDVIVNATDAYWNVATSATPTVSFSSTDANAVLPSSGLTLASGTKTFTGGVTLVTGNRYQTLTVGWVSGGEALTSDTTPQAYVTPGAATKLQVLLPGETAAPGSTTGKTGAPSETTAGAQVTLLVNAVDANWNIVSSITHVIAITSSDVAATLPSPAALTGGTQHYSVTLRTAGTATVTATDQASAGSLSTGTSASITIRGADGNGSMTVSPAAVDAGSSNNVLDFTFTMPTGGFPTDSAVSVQIPTDWTSPQTTSSSTAGYVTASGSGCSLAGVAVSGSGPWTITTTTSGVCPAGSTITTRYGADSSTKVTAPTLAQTVTFDAQSRSGSSGFATLAARPTLDVNPGATAQLAFTTPPAGAAATSTWGVTVAVQDTYGNTVTTEPRTISLSITTGTGPTGGTLTGATSLNTVAGVAAFTGLGLPVAGTGYGLTATSSTPTSRTVDSATVTITPGAASRLQVLMPGETAVPGTVAGKTGAADPAIAGVALDVTVHATDAYWNVVSSATPTVAMTRNYFATSGTVTYSGSTAALTSGSHTFSTAFLISGEWTVTATDQANTNPLTPDTGSIIDVTPGEAVKLQVLMAGEVAAPGTESGKTAAPPTPATAGVPTNAVVNAVDAYWNVVTTRNPTVHITTTDPRATSPLDIELVDGTRTFYGFFMVATPSGWTVTAADTASQGALAPATGAPVLVSPGAAARLQVLLHGHGTGIGQVNDPAQASGWSGEIPDDQPSGIELDVVVNVTDSFWNIVTSATPSITITPSDVHATCSSGCTTQWTRTATLGVATFLVKFPTAGYPTVTATAIGLLAGQSDQLDVDHQIATKFQVLLPGEIADPGSATGKTTDPPDGQIAGAPFAFIVNAVDEYWNVANAETDFEDVATPVVHLTSSDSGALLPPDEALVDGMMDFTITLTTATNSTISVTYVSGAPTTLGPPTTDPPATASSSLITVSAATATQLAFTTQPPDTAVHGDPFTRVPTVIFKDAYGNSAISNAPVTIAILAGTPFSGGHPGQLGAPGVTPPDPVVVDPDLDGVATFSGLYLLGIGTHYQLTATSGALTADTSAPIDVLARAITVTAEPSDKSYDGTTASQGTPTMPAGSMATGDTAVCTQTYDNPLPGLDKVLTPDCVITDGDGDADGQENYDPTWVTAQGMITGTAIVAPATMNLGAAIRGETAASDTYDVSWIAIESTGAQITLQMTTALTDGAQGTGHTIPSSGINLYQVNDTVEVLVGPLDTAQDLATVDPLDPLNPPDPPNPITGTQLYKITTTIPLETAIGTFSGELTFSAVAGP